MADQETEETPVTYCVHARQSGDGCNKCIELEQQIKDLYVRVEKMTFKLNVKFSACPPKGIDFTFE